MSSSSADRGQALDVGADVGSGRPAGQFTHEVFGELREQSGATAGHQVTQSDNRAFPHSHTRTHELSEEAGQDRLMEAHQSSAQPGKQCIRLAGGCS